MISKYLAINVESNPPENKTAIWELVNPYLWKEKHYLWWMIA
jgi:hypothetical protein